MPGNINNVTPADVLKWPTPNYVDPIQRTWMPVYAGVLQALSALMIAPRLWLRITKQAGALGLDDALLIPGFLIGVFFTGLAIISTTRYEENRHIWDVRPDMFEKILLTAWLSEMSFVLCTCCTKVSVLFFYRRLTTGTLSKRFKLATIVAIIFTCCYALALVLTLIFNCSPTDAYWKSVLPTYTTPYHCANTKFINPLSGVLSVASDIYGVVLPMAMMRHFETDRHRRVVLSCIFSLGLLVVAAGVVRTYYLVKFGTGMDTTWIGYDLFTWSLLEAQLALICASAPVLRVFFRKYLSDPISRAIHTRNSQIIAGGAARTQSHATDGSFSHQRDMSETSVQSDKHLVHYAVKPSLAVVGERDVEWGVSSPVDTVIKTPADFEAYALQKLEKHRPPFRLPASPQMSLDAGEDWFPSGNIGDEDRMEKSWFDG